MLEILKRKKVDKQDKQMPQSIEQLIEHYDLEKLWPYIEKIATHVNVNIEGIEDIPLLPTKIEGTLCVCPNGYYEGFFVAKIRKNK